MSYSKSELSKILHKTANVTASLSECVQFFRSKYFNVEETEIGNIIEDFLEFRGDLDSDIASSGDYMKDMLEAWYDSFVPSKIPKKVIKQLEESQREFEEECKKSILE